MTQRERVLAIAVVLLLFGVGGYYFLNQYLDARKNRTRQIQALAKKVREEEFIERKAQMALERLATYQDHALPESVRASQSFYQERLRSTIEAAGFREVVIKPINGRQGDNHYQHLYSLSGKATLDQLVQFSYEFYSFNILHKFTRLTVLPIRNSDELDVSMNVAVLSVNGATDVPTPEVVRLDQLAHGGLNDYMKVITERNLFAPANKPPLFTSKTTHEAELDRPFSIRISASDPDEHDQVSYFLGADPPSGVELTESGSLSWTPSALGEYKITVEARDNRSPPKSSTQELTVTVVEPRPEPEPSPQRPEFDEAKYTYLTATVTVGSQPTAWLNNRPKNTRLQLSPGDTFSIGTLQGKIVSVENRQVVIEVDGNQRVLSIGQSLADVSP